MTQQPFTARNIAKFVVTTAIAVKLENAAADTIVEQTKFEEDDLTVILSSKLIGWGVSSSIKPYTDKAVDKTADFVAAKREARQAKKNAKQEKKDQS